MVGLLILLATIIPQDARAEVPPPFELAWGTAGSGPGQFSGAGALAIGPTGNVYVADGFNHRIQVFDADGNFLMEWGSFGTGDGQFNTPSGIALDSLGNVYTTEHGNRVQKFSSTGSFLTKWGTTGSGDGQFNLARGITVDTNGNVFVIEQSNQRVQKFTGTGVFVTKWGTFGSGNGQFNNPWGIDVDSDGNVYVPETNNNRVQKFTNTGVFILKWGSAGSGDGQFNNPRGIDVDGSGNVYVTEYNNNRIQKFTNTGVFLAKWGTLGSGNGQFNNPSDAAADGSGIVYVADTTNRRIQKFGFPRAMMAAGPSLSEGNSGFTAFDFAVNLTSPAPSAVTVNYQTSDGTATVLDNDYQPVTGSIVIPAAASTGTITISVVGNTLIESDETFGVTISSVTGGAVLGSPASATGTILNDDSSPYTGLCLTFNRALPAPSSNSFALGYGDDDALWVRSQTEGRVYKMDPATGDVLQSFPTSGYADLDVRGGILYVLDEPTIYRYDTASGTQLSSLTGPVTGGARGLTFVGADLYVSGVLNGAPGGVRIGHVDETTGSLLGSSTSADITYSDGIGGIGSHVGFLAYDYTAGWDSVVLRIVDPVSGTTIEDHALFPYSSGGGEIFSLDASTTELFVSRRDLNQIWVYDLCSTQVTMASGPVGYEGIGGMTPFNFTVRLSSPATSAVTVNYETSDGTATVADNDYQPVTGSIVIPAADSSGIITISVIGDTLPESDETFGVTISSVTGGAVLGSPASATGTILNDDSSPYTGLCLTFNRALPAPSSNSFALGYGDDHALWVRSQTEGRVFKMDPTTGDVLQSFPTSGYADLDVRGGILYVLDEPTIFRYDTASGTQLPSLTGPVTGGARGLTFVGADLYVSGVLSGAPNEVRIGHVDETTGSLLGSSMPADITYSYGIGGIGSHVGFLAHEYTAGWDSVLLRIVDPVSGTTIEDHALFPPTSGSGEIYSLDASATELFVSRRDLGQIWVYDLCPTQVTMAGGPFGYEGIGGMTPFNFTVSLSAPATSAVTVNYETSDGTATVADNDYQPVTGSIVIPAADSSGIITINVVGDDGVELDETFGVTITSATGGVTLGSPVDAIGTIVDDDNPSGVDGGVASSERFAPLTNRPNPFRSSTRIEFGLPVTGHVELRVFSVSGRLVRLLRDEVMPAGMQAITWDGTDETGLAMPAGRYFYHLTSAGLEKTRGMTLLR